MLVEPTSKNAADIALAQTFVNLRAKGLEANESAFSKIPATEMDGFTKNGGLTNEYQDFMVIWVWVNTYRYHF